MCRDLCEILIVSSDSHIYDLQESVLFRSLIHDVYPETGRYRIALHFFAMRCDKWAHMGTYSPLSVINGNTISVARHAAMQNTHDKQFWVREYSGCGNIAGCL